MSSLTNIKIFINIIANKTRLEDKNYLEMDTGVDKKTLVFTYLHKTSNT